jgi:hypothetical protein
MSKTKNDISALGIRDRLPGIHILSPVSFLAGISAKFNPQEAQSIYKEIVRAENAYYESNKTDTKVSHYSTCDSCGRKA